MDKIVEKLVSIAAVFVIGLMAQHPFTWKAELRRIQYSMLKKLTRTDNWGNPSPFRRSNKVVGTKSGIRTALDKIN